MVDPALLSARREDAGYAEQQKTLAAQLEQARTEVCVHACVRILCDLFSRCHCACVGVCLHRTFLVRVFSDLLNK